MGARVVALGLGPGDGTLDASVRTRQADVTRQREVDEALADFDRLDILFNCAGIKRGQEHDPDVFQQVLDVNLTGTMGLRRRAARAEGGARLHRQHGVHADASAADWCRYAASKGGVGQLTVAGDRLRAGRHPRQRGGARLDHAADPGAGRPARAGPILARTPLARWGIPRTWRGRRYSCAAGGGLHDGRGAAGGRGYMVA